MKIYRVILFSLFLLSLFVLYPQKQIIDETNKYIETVVTDNIEDVLISTSEKADSDFKLRFLEFELTFSDFEFLSKTKDFNSIQSDTVILELNYLNQESLIKVESEDFSNFKIESRIETSVIIMEDGAHCDLTEWKHYYSDWMELKKYENEFVLTEYNEEAVKFPDYSLEELREIVEKECAEKFIKEIENIESQYSYPVEIAINRYFIRITGKNIKTGEQITKLVILNNLIGC